MEALGVYVKLLCIEGHLSLRISPEEANELLVGSLHGTTWNEFRKAGANVSGFRETMRPYARRVRAGDIFLFYLTGVMQWVWLRANTILAAFEIEATTSVYSGLLRMSDLLALQPNLDLALYLVAPDERRTKVQQEIARPTFAYREKLLPKIGGFIGFGKLMEKMDGIRRLGLANSLRPEFLRSTAEYFGDLEPD